MRATIRPLPVATFPSSHHRKALLVMVTNDAPTPAAVQALLQELRRRRHEVSQLLLVAQSRRVLELAPLQATLQQVCAAEPVLRHYVLTVREPAISHMAAKQVLMAEQPQLGDKDIYVTFLN